MMKSILTNKPAESSEASLSLQVKRLSRKSDVLPYLEQKHRYAVTALAYLEPEFQRVFHRWYVTGNTDSYALCLVAKGLSPNYVMTLGDKGLLDGLMDAIPLPGRTIINCEPEHLETVEGYYQLEWKAIIKRMVVSNESFIRAEKSAVRLEPKHIREINRLFKKEHGNHFSSNQIRKGVYYGIWRDRMLVAVAGTHLIAPSHGISFLGNVLTRSTYRNQGLATICVSAVTAELLTRCNEVVLNVEPHNIPAVRTYTRLGYIDDCRLIEAIGHRKSFIGVIINSVCRKLGLIPKYEERIETNG